MNQVHQLTQEVDQDSESHDNRSYTSESAEVYSQNIEWVLNKVEEHIEEGYTEMQAMEKVQSVTGIHPRIIMAEKRKSGKSCKRRFPHVYTMMVEFLTILLRDYEQDSSKVNPYLLQKSKLIQTVKGVYEEHRKRGFYKRKKFNDVQKWTQNMLRQNPRLYDLVQKNQISRKRKQFVSI